jgi:hypothetical protein
MGKKRMKGEAALYDEIKKTTAIALTSTAVLALDVRARELNISRSELVEKLARQEVAMSSENIELIKKLKPLPKLLTSG